jgi:hypothetical protein
MIELNVINKNRSDGFSIKLEGSIPHIATELEFLLRSFGEQVEQQESKERAAELINLVCNNSLKSLEDRMSDFKDIDGKIEDVLNQFVNGLKDIAEDL